MKSILPFTVGVFEDEAEVLTAQALVFENGGKSYIKKLRKNDSEIVVFTSFEE